MKKILVILSIFLAISFWFSFDLNKIINFINNLSNKVYKLNHYWYDKNQYIKENKINVSLLFRIELLKYQKKYPKIKNIVKKYYNNYLKNQLFVYPIKIEKIIDGDTIRFKFLNYLWQANWKTYKLRLIGVDTPEITTTRFGYTECYSKEAKNFLIKETADRKEYLYIIVFDKNKQKDKYWRFLGYLYLYNPKYWILKNINYNILAYGYWFEYWYNYWLKNIFKKIEEKAKKEKYWLWYFCDWKIKER